MEPVIQNHPFLVFLQRVNLGLGKAVMHREAYKNEADEEAFASTPHHDHVVIILRTLAVIKTHGAQSCYRQVSAPTFAALVTQVDQVGTLTLFLFYSKSAPTLSCFRMAGIPVVAGEDLLPPGRLLSLGQ